MKKIVKVIITMSLIIGLVYLYKNTDILDFVKCQEISNEERKQYSNRWYYNNLDEQQKDIYLHYAKGINDVSEEIRIKLNGSLTNEQIGENINKAIEAYSYDYPEIFYVESNYEVKIIDVLNCKIIEIHPRYINKANIQNMKNEMQIEIDNIKSLVKSNDTEYNKELIVHDYLVKNVQYYNWENLEDIPDEMHTAYNALVKKQAVCDGISKAFQIIMMQEGIECMTITGDLEEVPHAWNVIKIDNEYYHVDLTSDQFKLNKKDVPRLSHAFFNITDEEIKQTHEINKSYSYPKCDAIYNNFYYKENRIVKENQNLRNKVKTIVNNTEDEELLEIRVLNRGDVSDKLAQILYDIDFNKYKSNRSDSIGYTVTRDIYVYKIN